MSMFALQLNDTSRVILCLATTLLAAFAVSRLTKRAHLPNVTGYILAGIFIGPYCLGLVDGEMIRSMGFITDIDPETRAVTVTFDDDRVAVYEAEEVEDLELAYCVSVHKSQGSEFPVVVMPVVGGPPMLLTRNLFYTAVTRARQMVMLVGRRGVIHTMVRNANVTRRYSALSQRLREGI